MSNEEKLESERPSLPESGEEPIGLTAATQSSDLDVSSSDEDVGAGKKTIGLERWVQLGFMAAAILFVWVFDHLISAVWYAFADPDEAIVTTGAVIAGIATAIVLYGYAPAYSVVHGVTEELSKVTWPTRKETSSSTITVVVTSIIAALMLFLFDSVWSAVTDLVYKV